MTVALAATAIVVLALLFEVSLPWLDRRARAPRAVPRGAPQRRARPPYDPGRERRAEQRARELLRSCVNEEEWAMYRDLGFIRVWGGQAGGPRPAHRAVARPARRAVRLPRLPAPADRRLPAADRPAAQRVLRRVPGRDAPLRVRAAARLRRRARQVDGAQGRRAAPDRRGQHAPARPPARSLAGPARPLAPRPLGARAPQGTARGAPAEPPRARPRRPTARRSAQRRRGGRRPASTNVFPAPPRSE